MFVGKERAIKERLSRFSVHTLSPVLETAIPQLFQNIQLYKIHKLVYNLRQYKASAKTTSIGEYVQYVVINQDFLAQDQYQNIEYVKSEIAAMWSSQAAFYEHGFGYAALVEDTIVCWCTAEYVSAKTCGIGIETVESYQNKGIATATATHFVAHCLQHNITPYWECDVKSVVQYEWLRKLASNDYRQAHSGVGHFRVECVL
ncbi:MAG: hypothetical protein GFH27_549301n206 [Chloroflexi bacterium AL-W]|nr:hypothetical protein [Chloroflexi bacterium AL-N1]NOK68399.1 hypothetical protein [Chloroflexi bacterium AL-N10]NOK74045.1 hypothetical protein [Chloroflexi bacterium AL-N5]NOK83013.1 hypothetical protein [Chloroflexi bacterium AL-W]NOK90535.1 hypothetical protein [Chloroflexi bacterium AL-N15]